MNRWQIVLVILGSFCVVMRLYAPRLYDFDTGLMRKLGLERLAATHVRMKPWALPTGQVVMVLVAIASFVAAAML